MNTHLTCSIVDDEPLAVSLLESYVNRTPFLELRGKYCSAIMAMNELLSDPVDLLLLDIQMPELSGMEFSRLLPAKTKVIFTTAFAQYAVDSYRVNALDYLLKPISYTDFLQAAQKAVDWFEKTKPEVESLFIRSEYKLQHVDLNTLLYVEGWKDYVKLHVAGEQRPIVSLLSMKAVEELLPASRFVRVHRSFIVNVAKIDAIERNRIVFGKEYIPISDNYRQKFFDFLSEHSILLGK